MDLILVNPGNRLQAYQSLGPTLAAIEPSVWAGLMATFVRQHGFSVEILDANAEDLTPEEVAQEVVDRDPLLTAIVVYGHNPSASTQIMPAAGAICSVLKRKAPDQKVLLVGGHVAALPERTLREAEADFVCSGEGPYTVLELLQALQSDPPDLNKVRDLGYRDGETIQFTPPAPLVMNLDQDMPGIAWDLLPMDKYRAHNWHCFGTPSREPYASLYTTLGCPFRCSFCCIHAPFKRGERVLGFKKGTNSYRRWSPESVLAQIDTLVNRYGVRNIKFADEIFVLDPKHVLGICDRIIERGYDLNIWAYARVDSIRGNGILEKLKRAGVNWLALGIEAANERVRRDVQKRFDQKDVYRTVEAIHSEGIYIIGNYIFGLPDDTLETMQETLDLALELNCEFANFYCTMAYPGSQLYDLAVQDGWPLPPDWAGYSQLAPNTLPLPTRYLSGAEVLLFRDHAFQIYFHQPRYLEMVERKFGAETAHHIREMASHNLVRRHI
jgi:anaerobic magnesium-protoporphyrin IX monomethyl ester cyclase